MIFFIWGFGAAIVYIVLLIETEFRTRMKSCFDMYVDILECDFERVFKATFWPATVWFCIPRFLWTVYQYKEKMAKSNKEK